MNRLLILPVLLLTLLVGTPGFSADFQKGLTAYNKGDYATALREWTPLAEQGNATAQYNLGKMYSKGQGVPQDYKAAVNVPGFSAMPPTTPTERPDVAIEPVDPVDHTPPKYLGGIAGGLWSYISKQLAGDLRPGSSSPPPAGTPPIPGTEGGATSPVDPNRPPVSPLPPIGTLDNVNGKSAVRIEDVPGAISSLSPTTPCIPPTPCVPQDYKTALKWYRLAAEQGYADAQVNLGVMYTLGQGVRRNYKTAVKWYRLAAKQGVSLAQNNLGLLYVKGQGVVQDYVYAHMWWNIAASSGNKSAGTNRDKVAGKMTPSQLETAQKLARECVRKKYKGC